MYIFKTLTSGNGPKTFGYELKPELGLLVPNTFMLFKFNVVLIKKYIIK